MISTLKLLVYLRAAGLSHEDALAIIDLYRLLKTGELDALNWKRLKMSRAFHNITLILYLKVIGSYCHRSLYRSFDSFYLHW